MENKELVKPNSQQTLIEYCKKVKGASYEDVINSKVGSIRLIKQQFGEESAELMVITFITDLNDFFNFKNKMNSSQIAETSLLAIKNFPFWTPEDFSRCYENVKALKYGSLYESIDGSKVLNFMEKYEQDFIEEQKLYKKQNAEKKREEFENEMKQTSELVLPVLKKVVDDLDKKKIKSTPKPPRQQTETEKIIKVWFKEFDLLNKEQEGVFDIAGLRMVNIKGETVDINSFLNIKLEEYNENIVNNKGTKVNK